ncbi:DUF5953 family protein [Archangium primigenium]|uniref:DUF5953 family protein n=1 Tax=[Archangium] primigenium TaxID=2792470 RepID=UPI00195912C5|nr:DUF5953 family protein [Archangium primigenium]MBM7113934.1 hypothetical protein [Archangium primigenium]
MANPQSLLVLTVYAPALADEDSRPLAVIRGLERALPGLRLDSTISSEGRLIPLPRREMWLAEGQPNGKEVRLICNSDERYRVMVSGWERPAGISPGGRSQLEVHVKLPLHIAGGAVAVDVLELVGEATRAFWGRVTPEGVAAEMAQQVRHSMRQPHVPPRGLPTLKRTEELHSPELPHHLGWLNYWSDAASRAIGFPDSARDAELLSRSRRTATGGWVVQLTDAPLDLDTPAHLEALKRAYERFPRIGGRSTP